MGRPHDQRPQVAAHIHRDGSPMGGSGVLPGPLDGLSGPPGIEEGHGRQAHDGAVAGGHGICRAAVGLSGFLKSQQRPVLLRWPSRYHQRYLSN